MNSSPAHCRSVKVTEMSQNLTQVTILYHPDLSVEFSGRPRGWHFVPWSPTRTPPVAKRQRQETKSNKLIKLEKDMKVHVPIAPRSWKHIFLNYSLHHPSPVPSPSLRSLSPKSSFGSLLETLSLFFPTVPEACHICHSAQGAQDAQGCHSVIEGMTGQRKWHFHEVHLDLMQGQQLQTDVLTLQNVCANSCNS